MLSGVTVLIVNVGFPECVDEGWKRMNSWTYETLTIVHAYCYY